MEVISEYEALEESKERLKIAVSRFLENKLTLAVSLVKEAMGRGESPDIVQCLQSIWPQNDGVLWQRKPRFVIPDLDEAIAVRFEPDSNEYDNEAHLMTIAVGGLRRAKTPEELDEMLVGVIENVYHESEHIYSPGSDLEPVDTSETIEYLGNPGEIEAHARQFAYRYSREFPGLPFDPEKMAVLSEKIKNRGMGNKHYNYFVAFADKKKQELYKDFGNVRALHEKIVEATGRHLQILSEHAGIQID